MKYYSYDYLSAMGTIIMWIIFAFTLMIWPILSYHISTNHHQVTFTVNKSERVTDRGGESARYLIYTNNGVYENTDSLWNLKFNSSDLYNYIQPGTTYTCDAVGYRVPFLSWYENLVTCESSN
jgi:hypothetical protein